MSVLVSRIGKNPWGYGWIVLSLLNVFVSFGKVRLCRVVVCQGGKLPISFRRTIRVWR